MVSLKKLRKQKSVPHFKPLAKELDWKTSWGKCKPYVTNYHTGLDIGARIGEFAYYMNDFKQVYSFEFRQGKKNRYYSRCTDVDKYHFVRVGISDHNGYEYTTTQMVGKIKNRGKLKVKVKTIDSLNFTNVGFIKLDVEGHEYRCIKGAEQTIKKYEPVIIVEQNKGDFSASNLLIEWGYKIVDKVRIGGKIHDYILVKE